MGNRFNIPVPAHRRLDVRGDAEVKGQPPVGWWFKHVGHGRGRQIHRVKPKCDEGARMGHN